MKPLKLSTLLPSILNSLKLSHYIKEIWSSNPILVQIHLQSSTLRRTLLFPPLNNPTISSQHINLKPSLGKVFILERLKSAKDFGVSIACSERFFGKKRCCQTLEILWKRKENRKYRLFFFGNEWFQETITELWTLLDVVTDTNYEFV